MPYEGQAPYPMAAETWRSYNELFAASGLTLLSRARVQALMRRAARMGPARPGPALPSPAKSMDQALGNYRSYAVRFARRKRRPRADASGETPR